MARLYLRIRQFFRLTGENPFIRMAKSPAQQGEYGESAMTPYLTRSGAACKFILFIVFLCRGLSVSNVADAKPVDTSNQDFSMTMLGDREFGTDSLNVSVPSGVIRIAIRNAWSPFVKKIRGVGIIETDLDHSDRDRANDIFARLCKATNDDLQNQPFETDTHIYSIRCLHNEKIIRRSGLLSELPREVSDDIFSFYEKVFKEYPDRGLALVRVEAEITDIYREKENISMAVRFINSGRYPISIQTPDEWNTQSFDRLRVTAWDEKDTKKWSVDLAGAPLLNKADLSTWLLNLSKSEQVTLVTIPAGGDVILRIKVMPDEKIQKGNYKIGAVISTTMITCDETGKEAENGTLNLSKINLGTGGIHTFTFGEDYPSTSAEWREYETKKRARLSGYVVGPGEPFAEDGHYRLISNSGQRSRFVSEFKRGRTAAIEDDSLDEKDKPFRGRLAWQWEADSALRTRCDPHQPCPRDGHWVALTRDYGWLDKRYTLYADTKRYFSAGEIMPEKRNAYGDELRYLAWYWLGV
jgi:hypothetical protein